MSLKGNLGIWRAHEGHPTWDVFARTLTMFSDDYISMPQCPLLPPYIWYARHVERVARVEGVSIRKRTLAWRRAHPEMAMGSLEIDWELCFFYRFQFSPVWFTCYLLAYFCFLICSWLHLWSWRCQAVFHGGKVLAVKLFAEFVLRVMQSLFVNFTSISEPFALTSSVSGKITNVQGLWLMELSRSWRTWPLKRKGCPLGITTRF